MRRGLRRAQAIVDAFRPRCGGGELVLTGFGAFPGVPRNATAEIVRELARRSGIALCPASRRSREFVVGRGVLRLPSGRALGASLMVLPVAWDAAGALVAKEARARRARLVVMCGVAGPAQPIAFEAGATGARVTKVDALGARPRRARPMRGVRPATLDVEVARSAAQRALAEEPVASVPGVVVRPVRADNAYVCNSTAYVVARARLRAAHGFVHWPSDIPERDVPACARVVAEVLDALLRDPSR